MFKNRVYRTPLTTGAADEYFRNITGQPYDNDTTFVSTMRALLDHRIGPEDTVHVSFGSSQYSHRYISECPERRMVGVICSNWYGAENSVYIHDIQSRNTESTDANFGVLEREFCNVYKSYKPLTRITDFYRKSFRVLCFVDPASCSTILFVDNLNMQKLHYLQCSMLAFMPWYFDPNVGITDEEKALLNSLCEKTPDNYLSCIEKIAGGYDFESGRIKNLLKGFESKYERRQASEVRNDITMLDRDIENLMSRYASLLEDRNMKCALLAGLEQKMATTSDEDSEIMKYFLRNKRLYLENVTEQYMTFAVMGYLAYFDEEAAKKYISTGNGYMYRYCNTDEDREKLKELLEAIFIDETLKIRFCAAYKFNLGGRVTAIDNYYFSDLSAVFNSYMPNPHIDRYRCMGNYESAINKSLANRDYISALEQCIASAQSLNFHDSTVMVEFVRQLCTDGGKNNKCIELPDGTVVTPDEAMKYLEAQRQPCAEAAPDVSTTEAESCDGGVF